MSGKPARQPVRALIRKTTRVSPVVGARFQKVAIRLTYEAITLRIKADSDGFMNYGYAPLDDAGADPLLASEDATNQYGANLYRKVVGTTDLTGKDVLEVGSGRGAGTALVRRTWNPRSVIGVDLARRAVAFCRRHYPDAGLSFQSGDAEHLPFAASSFDVVLNVESSHGYPNFTRFASEVARVLRPGGIFLFADLRAPAELQQLRESLGDVGLAIVEEELITANVVRALELDSGRKEQVIAAQVPRRLRPGAREFMAVQSSDMFNQFSSREMEYIRLMARKR